MLDERRTLRRSARAVSRRHHGRRVRNFPRRRLRHTPTSAALTRRIRCRPEPRDELNRSASAASGRPRQPTCRAPAESPASARDADASAVWHRRSAVSHHIDPEASIGSGDRARTYTGRSLTASKPPACPSARVSACHSRRRGDDSPPMRVCLTCGRDLVFASAIRPEAATVAEMLCTCPGRFWRVDRATGTVLEVVDQPRLDDRD